jgi:hypothetical protein
MTGEQLQEELENVRLRLLEALAALPDQAFIQPGVVNHYSLRDWLFLLSAWEAELVTGLMRVQQGRKPERLLTARGDRQGYEAQRLRENPDRDLDRIFDDLQGVRIELEGWLEQFPDKQLTDRKRYGWLSGRSLAQLIAEISFQYEAEALPAVESFAAEWPLGAQNGAGQAILINDIEVQNDFDGP